MRFTPGGNAASPRAGFAVATGPTAYVKRDLTDLTGFTDTRHFAL